MRIGVLGTGRVGQALGKRWAAAGHTVVFGSRHPASVDCAAGPADSIAGAAGRSQVVVLAVPFAAVGDTLAAAGDLTGKIVVDATNPMGSAIPDGHASGAQWVAAASGSRVVKAFNTMGWETMANPVVEGRPALGLVCGDDSEGKEAVFALAREMGFDAVDAGGLDAAILLEGMARLWVHLAFAAGLSRDVAFALLRRSP